ncbi:MAG: septal ring lytic transglycosylase RlpA family protein [Pseudomonadota bacterium]
MSRPQRALHVRAWHASAAVIACLLSACATAPTPQTDKPPAKAAPPAQASRSSQSLREFQRGVASWYGADFNGKETANGERYDMKAMTAAHKTLPFDTRVLVRSVSTGREVEVRINDRGPFVQGRIIDLSHAAAQALGIAKDGVEDVLLLVAGSLPKDD